MNRFNVFNRLCSRRSALAALLLCGALTGCGPGVGEVSGTVRYDGKPLTSGTIQFLARDGIPYAAQIQADGTFAVQVPVGEARVIISSVDEARQPRGQARRQGSSVRAVPPPGGAGVGARIPLRYADWDTSGLTVLVEEGETVRDFALVSK
jgi:hypothetical protein